MSKFDKVVAVLDDMCSPSTQRKHEFNTNMVEYVDRMREIAVQSIKFVIEVGSLLEKSTEFFVLPPYEQCCIQLDYTDGGAVVFFVRETCKHRY